MKIASFKARGVFGYLNISIAFESNPHILIAPNGAGKTTAIRLMQALLTPSLRDLLLIDFQEASLVFSDSSGPDRVINARKGRSGLMLSISGEDSELQVPVGFLREIDSDSPSHRRERESDRVLRLKYADDPVFMAISAVNMPVFLGLDRRSVSIDDYPLDASRSDFAYRDAVREDRLTPRGALGSGLRECQMLVQNAYRRVRRLQDMQAQRLRKKLLLTGFEYAEFDFANTDPFQYSKGLAESDLLDQRRDLIAALVSVGVNASDAERELNPFFEKVIALSKRLALGKEERDKGAAFLEAMLNRASIMRLKQLVEVVRDFNKSSQGLTQKFESFLSCVNSFLVDSRKEMSIDSVGMLRFMRADKSEVPPEALSSGERQILIMFSHLFFNSFGDRSNVFIIDEPEVSLHLRWQESLLQKMMESSPRAQIIVATHSPEIVGELTAHCTGIV